MSDGVNLLDGNGKLVWISDPSSAYHHARYVRHARCPEVEHIILQSAYWSHYYAYAVIRGPWPAADSIIITNPEMAYYHAKDVLKRRWPDAEEGIFKEGKKVPKAYLAQFPEAAADWLALGWTKVLSSYEVNE